MSTDAEVEWTNEDSLLLELHQSATRLRRFGRFFEIVALAGSLVLAGLFIGVTVFAALRASNHGEKVALLAGLIPGLGLIYFLYVSSAVIGTFCRTYALARLLDVDRS